MAKIILIYANCRNPTAKGDFSLAGQMAKDLAKSPGAEDLVVILTSTLDGIARFESLYGTAIDGQVIIEGQKIGLCALELLDAVDNEVVAFIESNRCKHAPADIIKRVLSPESKFLFIGASNQPAMDSRMPGSKMMALLRHYNHQAEQPGVYEHFDPDDVLIGASGIGEDRLGLATLNTVEQLQPLTLEQQAKIPVVDYGFIYLNGVEPSKDMKTMTQYMELTRKGEYVLVGEYAKDPSLVQYVTLKNLSTNPAFVPHMPKLHFHTSLDNGVMRNMVKSSAGNLVVSTGVQSSLEAMQDGKLTYYQTLESNQHFVASYLQAVQSICSSDDSLIGVMPQLIIDLSTVLFAEKPLSSSQMGDAERLLHMSSVPGRLVDVNKRIIAKASGTLAGELLSFIGQPGKTQLHRQCISVCKSLRKEGESAIPLHDQALRRAAAWGRVFELKVLIKSMSASDLDKRDTLNKKFTALHWAVFQGHHDCARLLVNAGASVDVQDGEGRTPLHYAVKKGDRNTIALLVKAGASLEVTDVTGVKPCDDGPDWVPDFIKECHVPHQSGILH